jgi:Spy/CpxP family protein refolding chaperone
MTRTSLTKWTTFAAIATILAGCGTTSGLLAAQTNTSLDAAASADPNGPHGGHRGGKGGERGAFGFVPGVNVADLALTADQQTALKAVMDKYRPAAPAARPSGDPGAELRAIVTADTVDDAKLRAAIAAMEANKPAAPQVDHAAMLAEIRAILTDDQRAKIVAALQADTASPRPRPSGDPRAEKLASLDLTTEQKAALDALDAARKPAGEPADRKAAMVAFWQNGDTTGLAAPTRPAFPVEAFVAAIEILDATQRKALFGNEGGMMGFGGHGHGGPGGERGGHGGDRGGDFGGRPQPQG